MRATLPNNLRHARYLYSLVHNLVACRMTIGKGKKVGAYAMKRVAGAHPPIPWLLDPVKVQIIKPFTAWADMS